MALAGKGTPFWVKASSEGTSNHKGTFRPAEQHLAWCLQRSSVRQDGDFLLETKEPHLAGTIALHVYIILEGKENGGIGLWSEGIRYWH